MSAMVVNVCGAGTVKAVGEFVVAGIWIDLSGLGIGRNIGIGGGAHPALVAPEVGKPCLAVVIVRYESIGEHTVVNLIQERDLHQVSEAGAQSRSRADIRLERWRRLVRIPTAELTQRRSADVRYRVVTAIEFHDTTQPPDFFTGAVADLTWIGKGRAAQLGRRLQRVNRTRAGDGDKV